MRSLKSFPLSAEEHSSGHFTSLVVPADSSFRSREKEEGKEEKMKKIRNCHTHFFRPKARNSSRRVFVRKPSTLGALNRHRT
jgi:hypothetical protein